MSFLVSRMNLLSTTAIRVSTFFSFEYLHIFPTVIQTNIFFPKPHVTQIDSDFSCQIMLGNHFIKIVIKLRNLSNWISWNRKYIFGVNWGEWVLFGRETSLRLSAGVGYKSHLEIPAEPVYERLLLGEHRVK